MCDCGNCAKHSNQGVDQEALALVVGLSLGYLAGVTPDYQAVKAAYLLSEEGERGA